VAPPLHLCTDNAIMVAWAGIERLRHGRVEDHDVAARARWPLEELARPLR
jgi:N6-L-threonylcarbamoyladenine synthase